MQRAPRYRSLSVEWQKQLHIGVCLLMEIDKIKWDLFDVAKADLVVSGALGL